MLKKIAFVLGARCVDVTRILSDTCDETPSRHQRWATQLHLISCPGCRRFRSQLTLLERLVALMPPSAREQLLSRGPRARMTPEIAAKWRRAIKTAQQSGPSS